MIKNKCVILISGRGSNMEAIFKSSQSGELKELCEVVLVAADKESAGGLARAESLGIKTAFVPSKGKSREEFENDLLAVLLPLYPDFVILAGFNRILTKHFISAFPNRIINIHPADTRSFQGLHGYAWAFENKLASTMITVHFVDEGVDTGNIIAQAVIDISSASSLEEVEHIGLAREHSFYCETLKDLFLKLNKEE